MRLQPVHVVYERIGLFATLLFSSAISLPAVAQAGFLPPLDTSNAAELNQRAVQGALAPLGQDAKSMQPEPDFVAALQSLSSQGWTTKVLLDFEGQDPKLGPAVSWQPLLNFKTFSDAQKLEMLLELGCSRILRREYQRGQRLLIVDVYRFNTAHGAYGAYSLLRQGASTVVTRGDGSSEDDQSISFWQDRYFVQVSATSQEDEESKEVVRVMADKVAAIVSAHASIPPIVSSLPRLDRVRGSEKLVMGPSSARRAYPAPYLSALMLDRMSEGAVADYKVQASRPERLKLLLVDYATEQLARQAFNSYAAVLNGQHEGDDDAAEDAGNSKLYRIGNQFLLCQIRGRRIWLINGARKKMSSFVLSRQIN